MSDKEYPAHKELANYSNGFDWSQQAVYGIHTLQDEFNHLRQSQQQNAELIRELLELAKDVDYALRNIWALERKKFEEEILPRTKAAIQRAETALSNQQE